MDYILSNVVAYHEEFGELPEVSYQSLVNEYSGYFNSLVYACKSGMLPPSAIQSNREYGASGLDEELAYERVVERMKEAGEVINVDINRCNPFIGISLLKDGKPIVSLLVAPKRFLRALDWRRTIISKYSQGFMMIGY